MGESFPRSRRLNCTVDEALLDSEEKSLEARRGSEKLRSGRSGTYSEFAKELVGSVKPVVPSLAWEEQ